MNYIRQIERDWFAILENFIPTCSVTRGGILAMRPLLLHSSLAALNPTHCRMLHFEYASIDLPAELDWFEAAK